MPAVAPILGNIALNLLIGVGASILSSLLKPQKAQTTPTSQRVTRSGMTFDIEVGEATSVSAIFGLGRARGQLVYVNEYGTNNEYVQFAIKIGHGYHDGLEAFLVDEKPVTLAGSNADPRGRSVTQFTRSGTPYMWVKTYLGAPGQTADPELVAQANPAGRWTSAHKMTGCAYMIVTCRYDEDFFGSTVPRFGSVWRGLRLYDWRVPGAVWGDQTTYVFTKNPAVIRYNFRRGVWVNGVRVLGQGFPAFSCDTAGYTAAANRCDETFYDPVSGLSFPVFEYGRQVTDDEQKQNVLEELDDSYCGSSFRRGGADVPLPAQQLVSLMTLNNSDRIIGESIRTDRKGTVSMKKTMWHGQFVSSDENWQEAPFTPRIDTDLESVIGGRRSAVMNQPYEYVQERAQLRAEIALRRQFFPATRTETFSPKALVLEPGDPVTRVCEWGSMLMVVERVAPLEDRTGVVVTLSQWSNVIVPASGDDFVDLPPVTGPGAADPDRTIAVSGLNVVAYQRTGGGAVHPHGRATWTPITDPNVDQVMIRVWPSIGDEVLDSQDFFATSRLQSALVFGPLQPETEYSYKAIPIRSDARTCVWTSTGTFTTGVQEVPGTTIPDDSIQIVKLVEEIRNRLDIVVGDIPSRILELEAEIARQASAGFTESATNKRRVQLLKAQVGGAVAAVIQEQIARADADSAMAVALTQVLAQVDGLFASGLIRFEARVAGGGAEATIAIMVRVGEDDDFVDSGIFIKATKVGMTTTSEILLLAQKLFITDGVNTKDAFTFDAVTGELVLKSLRFQMLKSLDGTTIVQNGTTGDFSFG